MFVNIETSVMHYKWLQFANDISINIAMVGMDITDMIINRNGSTD